MSNYAMRVAMLGHKRIPGRESGVEVVVEQLSTRLAAKGFRVDAYNRKNKAAPKDVEYKGVRLIRVPTLDKKSLDAPIYAAIATVMAGFRHYDVIHYHAEGSCIMLWLAKLLGKKTVVTIHGLDWQRAKWGGLATKVLRFGERCAAKYAGEIIVLSQNVQNYFADTYRRQTVFIPNGVEPPSIRDDRAIADTFGLQKDGYVLYLGRIVPEKGLDNLLRAYMDIDTDKKLVIAGGSSHTDDKAFTGNRRKRPARSVYGLCRGRNAEKPVFQRADLRLPQRFGGYAHIAVGSHELQQLLFGIRHPRKRGGAFG